MMAKRKLKVTGLELETKDGKKVNLTLSEAKELHEQLDELFGSKYNPSYPVYIDRWHQPYWYYTNPTITTPAYCGTANVSASTNCLNITYTGEAVAA